MAVLPDMAANMAFSHTASLLYGGFSGIFVGRAGRLWRLSLHPEQAHLLVKDWQPVS